MVTTTHNSKVQNLYFSTPTNHVSLSSVILTCPEQRDLGTDLVDFLSFMVRFFLCLSRVLACSDADCSDADICGLKAYFMLT